MNKKIIIYGMLSAVALTLVGCGNSGSSQAIKELENQLEHVQNSVQSVANQDLSSICRSCDDYQSTYTQTPMYSNTFNLLNLQNKVSNDINMQEKLSSDIKTKISDIKSSLKSGKKYSSNQVQALNSLSAQLSNYSSKLNSTTSDVKQDLKVIKYNQNVNHISLDKLGSGYNGISNTLELRKAYYFNLANTLNQIESIVSPSNSENKTFINDDKQPDSQDNEQNDEQIKYKNINIPDPTPKEDESQPTPREINLPPRYNYPPNANGANYNGAYGPNGYGYGMGYGYNGMYPYNNAFNPARNTDTYRPNYVNIDTYRWTKRGTLPNGEYEVQFISTKPFQVIEEDEELKDEQADKDQSQTSLNADKTFVQINREEADLPTRELKTDKPESNQQKLMRQNNKILRNQ